MSFAAEDIKFMKVALGLATRGLGFTEPNPMVGAVVVKDGRILSRGFHRRFGELHAEQAALEPIEEKDTTLYVTLEPCCHYGKTPPCTEAITRKHVGRVVIASSDPNPLVNGRGIAILEKRGIRVDVGLLGDRARHINRHYCKYMTGKLPYVTINAGVSMDGKLTDKYRKSQWITGPELREYSHSFRGEFSAIMAGVQTIIDDNPQLTIRDEAWGDKGLSRVILDTRNILEPRYRVFQEQERFPLIIFSSNRAGNKEKKTLHHYFVNPGAQGLDLREVLQKLHQLNICSVLVEGGGRMIDSFIEQKLYDEMLLFTAGNLIGGEGSVQLFAGGTAVSEPVRLKDLDVVRLESGYLARGFK